MELGLLSEASIYWFPKLCEREAHSTSRSPLAHGISSLFECWEVSLDGTVAMERLCSGRFLVSDQFGFRGPICHNVELLSLLDINELPCLCTS